MRTPVDLRHRALAWGLLLCVIAIAFVAVVLPLNHAFREYDHRIERSYEQLARLRAIADMAPDAKRQIGKVLERDLGQYLFVDTHDAGDVALALRKLIEGIADRHQFELKSIDNLKAEAHEQAMRTGVIVRADCSLNAMVELLDDLEHHRPLVFVDSLKVTPLRARRRGDSGQQQRVVASFELWAYFLEAES